MARVMAEGGFGVARDVAGSGIGAARDVAGTALTQFLALRGANGDATGPRREPAGAGAPPPAHEPPVPPDAAWRADVPASDSLPIPDYDELSASQVVMRLDGLDRDSLEAIRRYETDHRGRNTILGKIAQLT